MHKETCCSAGWAQTRLGKLSALSSLQTLITNAGSSLSPELVNMGVHPHADHG